MNLWTYIHWENGHTEPADRFYPGVIEFLGYEPWTEPMTLGAALRAERRRRGLAISGAALLVGVDEGTFGRWERGEWKPTRLTLPAIDAFLRISSKDSFPEEVRYRQDRQKDRQAIRRGGP